MNKSFLGALQDAREEYKKGGTRRPIQLNVQRYTQIEKGKERTLWHCQFKLSITFRGNNTNVFARFQDAIEIYKGMMPNLEADDGYYKCEKEWEKHCITMYKKNKNDTVFIKKREVIDVSDKLLEESH